MQPLVDTLVIGAGQAGLAAGYQLQQAKRSFAMLDGATEVGGSWPHYYDSLRLFSPARFSSLPGLPFPGDPERYPTRDEVVAYLRQYATHFALPIVPNARVTAVAHDGVVFTVTTADGRTFGARSLIAATGSFGRPALPQLRGQELFGGTAIHSFAYRTPAPFADQRVVVVGAGNSAVQIAVELAQVADVTLATSKPVRFVQQRPWGRDIHFWWWLTAFDRQPLDTTIGRQIDRKAAGPRVLDTGVYQAALAAGKPERRPMFERFTANGVVWADGREEAVDAVIFATGYRPNLDYLAPLGALDADGQAIHQHGVSLKVPGLAFVGISNQRTFSSAALRGVGDDADYVVRALAPHLDGMEASPRRAHSSLARMLGCCPTATAGS